MTLQTFGQRESRHVLQGVTIVEAQETTEVQGKAGVVTGCRTLGSFQEKLRSRLWLDTMRELIMYTMRVAPLGALES